jgi:hypothetical protein
MLRENGYHVRDAIAISTELDTYRAYLQSSAGELTAAKDQNVRLRSGWFSDRSATYLASGRPVITQDTGFARVLPYRHWPAQLAHAGGRSGRCRRRAGRPPAAVPRRPARSRRSASTPTWCWADC